MKIILQALQDDYVELDLEALLGKLDTIASTSRGEAVYSLNIHLGVVASGVPYAFVAHKNGCGFFVSVASVADATTALLRTARVAKCSDDASTVDLTAGDHRLLVPRGVFVSLEMAKRAIAHFCETGACHPEIEWDTFNASWYAE